MRFALRVFGFGFPFSVGFCIGGVLGWQGVGIFLAGFFTALVGLAALGFTETFSDDHQEER